MKLMMKISMAFLLLLAPIFISGASLGFFPIVLPRIPERFFAAKKIEKIPYTVHYFPQEIDHFSYRPKSYNVFNQKYLINSTFWKRGEPIFVYTGNEGDIEWFAANTGFLMDIAPRFKAMLLFIEHRYYGESMPFGEKSYKSAEQLGYLNSAQALADYAVLIRSLKQNISAESSPVVVFGGSYGGMLAAWFRLKYPQIAIGALASSAPILQFEDITPWSSFYDAVSQSYKDESKNCFEVIKKGWDELMKVSIKTEGLSLLSKTFRPCKNLNSVYQVRDWLWEAFVYTAMVNYPMKANFIKSLPANPVQEMCRIIDGFNQDVDKLTKVFSAATLYYNYSGSQTCFDMENYNNDHGISGWGWQACTEMDMPMTCSNKSMFPPTTYDYKTFGDTCMEKYNVRPRQHWITTEYGGHDIKNVLSRFGSNIIFSNGMKDPWSRGGVLENISTSIIALVTSQGAHHLDLRSATKEDPAWLKEQRKIEENIIRNWIDEYKETKLKN